MAFCGPLQVGEDEPWDAQTGQFHPQSQTWLDSGFALMSVNDGGSSTFGRDFQQKINGSPGHWELEDIVAARNRLHENGIANSEHVLLMG